MQRFFAEALIGRTDVARFVFSVFGWQNVRLTLDRTTWEYGKSCIAKMLIFSYRRMIMAYSPDFRKKVLETLSRGLSVRTTAALFGIHFTTIQNWKKHPEKAKTPQKRPPKKIRTEELLADIEMYPTDYLSERAKRFKCTPAAIRKAMLRNKFSKKRRY